jgi:hypothetical protein
MLSYGCPRSFITQYYEFHFRAFSWLNCDNSRVGRGRWGEIRHGLPDEFQILIQLTLTMGPILILPATIISASSLLTIMLSMDGCPALS